MRKFTSLDIYFVLKELRFLIGAKIDKIYQDRDNFVFSFHKGGKHLLKIDPNIIYLTSFKGFWNEPGNFCMFLRKYLCQGRLRKIEQKNFERVIELHIENKKKYIVVIELFGGGNLILCDKDYNILYPLHSKKFKDRTIKKGEKYIYPPSFFKGFEKFKLEGRNLVRTLALDYGFGGLYAEEVCLRVGVEKDSEKLTKNEENKIKKAINSVLKIKVKANKINNEVYPFELKLFEKDVKKYFESFSKAIDSYESFDNPYNKKIRKVMKVIEKQKENVENLKKEIEENKKKGDLIYMYYSEIEGILNRIKEMRDKKIPFDEIGKEIGFDIKNGKILLNLE
jgi:predicted ribosome quality control (RQC) complex YloA/Tae2 family protein